MSTIEQDMKSVEVMIAPKSVAQYGADRLHPLNNCGVWMTAPAYDAPLNAQELAQAQADLDSIMGTTREGASIAKIVWNGDRRYWKEYYTEWDALGVPTKLYRRPQVLYMSIFDSHDNLVRDAFPPRWLIMTRIEPEQYAATWYRDAHIFDPVRRLRIPIKPVTPPAEWHVWFATIAEHDNWCCAAAAEREADCHGFYAPPSQFLEEARRIRRSLEASGVVNRPFDSPDRVARRLREGATNNYEEQAYRRYQERQLRLIDEAPLIAAPAGLAMSGKSLPEIRRELRDGHKREMDEFEKKIRGK